jgi:hypothetical protein
VAIRIKVKLLKFAITFFRIIRNKIKLLLHQFILLKMRKLILLITICTAFLSKANSATDTLRYFYETFETQAGRERWVSQPIDPVIKWDFWDGGEGGNPLHAKNGLYNARFYWSDFLVNSRLLSSPSIDLSIAHKPQLTFWLAQIASPAGQDQMRLLFKANTSAPWDTILVKNIEVPDWTKFTINIADYGTKYLTSTFKMGFLGMSHGGWGVCVDDVIVEEKDAIKKYARSVDVKHVQHYVIPSGVTEIPVLKMIIDVTGNTDSAMLKTVKIKSLYPVSNLVSSNGFNLFLTTEENFQNKKSGASTKIASNGNVVGGYINFTGINKKLAIGQNVVWLTANIKSDAPHNSVIDFMVEKNNINVNDSLFPKTDISPAGVNTIEESVFFDDFETNKGWTITPDFERAVPLGRIVYTTQDPPYAYSGNYELGTDLTGDGAYLYNIDAAHAYYATSPAMNLKYYDNVKLSAEVWNSFESNDRGVIEVSVDGGTTWNSLWNSQVDGLTPDNTWNELLISDKLNQLAARKSSVIFRFGLVYSDNFFSYAGFNIDNFAITGNHLENDLGITQLKSPYSDCLSGLNDSVKIVVRNYAQAPSKDTIPLCFGIYGLGGPLVRDTIFGSIPINDSVNFTFHSRALFPQADVYDKFIVSVNMAGDEAHSNDTIGATYFMQDNIVPPNVLNFEYKGGLWKPKLGSNWACLVPDGSIPIIPSSPHSWIESPFGNYPDNETSWIESSCYDLSSANRQIIGIDYWILSEAGKDGACLQYTTDDGAFWHLIDSTKYSNKWGWYRSNVTALGNIGWSGSTGGPWKSVKELLPAALTNQPRVKFRVKWASDAANNNRGFAFDNIKIYPAPPDVGASSIIMPKDTCQFTSTNAVKVYVKNYGYNKLKSNDTIILGVDVIGQNSIKDTFKLSSDLLPGDSTLFTVNTPMNVNAPGLYHIRAYTLIEKDPFFYNKNNDTVTKAFRTWQNPVTLLADTIFSREPDTVYIRPQVLPQYTFLWDDNSTGQTYHVTVPRTYRLTVTESIHGCHTNDSVYVQLLFNDVGIDSVIWPKSSCSLGSAEKVKVQIRNFGTDSLVLGNKINVSYSLNGGSTVKDSVTLNSSFYKGTSKWFQFDHKTENMSAVGDYNIKTYSHFAGDTVTSNDSISRTIKVYGFPTFNLGNDTVIKALSYTFHVNPGFAEYNWSDGDSTATKVIDQSGFYWLDILDHNGCPASDSIDVWLKIRDVRASALLSPVTECNRTGTDAVNIRIQNSGTDTIRTSDDIVLAYKINQTTPVSETIHINNLLPGQFATHTFIPSENLTTIGSYDFDVIATTTGDLRTDNDTLTKTIYSRSNPVVNFGIQDYEPVKAITHLFDAGYGHDYTYLWQDNSVNQTYTATDAGTVSVSVTDTVTGCIGGDTVFLNLDILDYTVNSIGINSSSCKGKYGNVQVGLLNNGNQLRPSTSLTLNYMLGNTLLFTESYESRTNWPAGATRTFTTPDSINLNTAGNQQLKVIVLSDGDLRPENDTFTKAVTVLPSPVITLDSSQVVSLPHTLDAGSGFATYLWRNETLTQTLSTIRTLSVTDKGIYNIKVTDNYGCANNKNIYVNKDVFVNSIAADDMSVNIYPNPAVDFITVEAKFEKGGTHILEIFNSQGTLFETSEINTQNYKQEFNLGDFAPGVYFIRIHNSTEYHISKMVIQ